jgi:hypothetical protein
VARIYLIPKSGIRSEISNYRGESILPVVPKVFEHILFKNIFRHVSPWIIDEQFGFLPNKSTITNLTAFMEIISDYLNKGSQVDIIYLYYFFFAFRKLYCISNTL